MRDLIRQLESVNLVVSLIFGFLLAILANFLTGPLQTWLARRSATRAEKRSRELESDLHTMEKLAQSPLELALTLTASGVKVVICFSLASAITTLALIPEWVLSDVPSFFLQAVAALLFLAAMLFGMDMLRKVNGVRDFTSYRERTERELADLKARNKSS